MSLVDVFVIAESKCLFCGSEGAYVGLNSIECDNPDCEKYVQKAIAPFPSVHRETRASVAKLKSMIELNFLTIKKSAQKIPEEMKKFEDMAKLASIEDQLVNPHTWYIRTEMFNDSFVMWMAPTRYPEIVVRYDSLKDEWYHLQVDVSAASRLFNQD